jgi:hypothetical protein
MANFSSIRVRMTDVIGMVVSALVVIFGNCQRLSPNVTRTQPGMRGSGGAQSMYRLISGRGRSKRKPKISREQQVHLRDPQSLCSERNLRTVKGCCYE